MRRRDLLKMFCVAPAIILTPNLLMPVKSMKACLTGVDPNMKFIGVDPAEPGGDKSSIWLISWGNNGVQCMDGQFNGLAGRYS